ncbi:hypothetical protein [Rubellimicrobium roseum]|uniref:Uncharacterized protein n=1 Tax=Rubellimicrobium roseum TaxID=687525 RepID=A0A5C4NLK5_9RHOB|nr:hypothetical protein [Rubellimicrobium roseum]TNC74870.1 hypothetical protein FHG71_01690 [Rubellimicrobium roseum]
MYDMLPDAHEGTTSLSERQTAHMEAVAEQLGRLNAAIREAVDAGLAVELHRSERYHCGGGCWGDMMKPVIVKCV